MSLFRRNMGFSIWLKILFKLLSSMWCILLSKFNPKHNLHLSNCPRSIVWQWLSVSPTTRNSQPSERLIPLLFPIVLLILHLSRRYLLSSLSAEENQVMLPTQYSLSPVIPSPSVLCSYFSSTCLIDLFIVSYDNCCLQMLPLHLPTHMDSWQKNSNSRWKRNSTFYVLGKCRL